MAEIEKDPMDSEMPLEGGESATAAPEASEPKAKRGKRGRKDADVDAGTEPGASFAPSLKDLILSAENAMGGFIDDQEAPPAEAATAAESPNVEWEMGTAEFIESEPAKEKKAKKSKGKAAKVPDSNVAEQNVAAATLAAAAAFADDEAPATEETRVEEPMSAADEAIAAEASIEAEVMADLAVSADEILAADDAGEMTVETATEASAAGEEISTEDEAGYRGAPQLSLIEGGASLADDSVEALEARAENETEPSEDLSEDGLNDAESKLADEELGPAEFIEADRMQSIIESLLFASDRPVTLNTIKQIFKGSNIRTRDITRCLDQLASEYARVERGVTLEEINGGYQLRTKVDNAEYLKRLSKNRPFRLSGPALETLAIMAYKQPITKHEVDEIRGVESGHLIRALMERGLVCFNGKSDLPGKPMQYGTTRKFLETFGLRNLKELPTLSEIDELLPEGIGDEVEENKPKLADLTDKMSEEIKGSYSEGEDELQKITDSLNQIDTSSEFFEQEKIRQRERRDSERAANIREAMAVGEVVDDKDAKWLQRYEAKLAEEAAQAAAVAAQAAAIVEAGAQAQAAEAAQAEEFREGVKTLTDELQRENDGGELDAEEREIMSDDENAVRASTSEDSEDADDLGENFMNDSDWDDLGDGDPSADDSDGFKS